MVHESGETLRFGPFAFDCTSQRLFRREREVNLGRAASALLALLVNNRHRPVSKDEILACIGETDGFADQRVFNTIWTLRRYLGEYASDRGYIVTVPKMGYQFMLGDEQLAS